MQDQLKYYGMHLQEQSVELLTSLLEETQQVLNTLKMEAKICMMSGTDKNF